jgi:ferredoxin-like protein FixX
VTNADAVISVVTDPVQIIDLYKRREDLKRDLAAVEVAIERCHHDWAYTPASAFEDRDDRWVRVTYRTCPKCGTVNERLDATPRGPLGEWQRTAKFKAMA